MAIHITERIHEELLNWSRWCWSGSWPHPLPPTHCGSLEAGYRSPEEWGSYDEDEAPPPAVIQPNVRHARIVQAAWESLAGLPRLVLKAEYPARPAGTSREARAQTMGVLILHYEAALQRAVRSVEDAFAVRA